MAMIQSPKTINEVMKSFPICLSAVNPSNFISSKLWGDKQSNNYSSWKEQMLCLIESHDLLCFIDGTIPPPPQGSTTEYQVYRRSDRLLKAWILSSLTDAVLKTVANSATARDVWLELEKNFSELDAVKPSNIAGQRDLNDYLPLYKAVLDGNWETIEQILDNDPDASKARINCSKQTALHVAVVTEKPYHFVEKLVLNIPDESIALEDDGGNTALSIAATNGYKEAAILLVNKMPNLLYIPNNMGNFPIQQAALFSQRGMFEYLISVTKDNLNINPYAGMDGLRLLIYVIDAKFLDLAICLVEKYPHVATLKLLDNTSALKEIAAKSSLFFSSKDFNFQQRILLPKRKKREITDQALMIRQAAIELTKCLCKRMVSMSHKEAEDIYIYAVIVATELGSSAFIELIVEAFPDAKYCSTSSSKQSIFHIAVQNRFVDVFNVISQKTEHSQFMDKVDFDGNNLLHAAAKLAPSHKLNEVSGAALQMQREIQWYKMVEDIVHPNCRNQPNKAGKTPKMIFEEEHKKLKEEAEKWTKDTVNSCMVAAALIAGASFAGGITVPGGYDSGSGFPIFNQKMAFQIYLFTNIMSFLMATFCLLLLLFMLVARYADEDFLLIIPSRLTLSLVSLFISVAYMVASFLAALFIISERKDKLGLRGILVGFCIDFLAIAVLVLLAFGPLRHYFSGRYGTLKSDKKSNRPS